MASTTWLETSPNGFRTGSVSTTMPTSRSAIHLVHQMAAIKAFAEVPGKARRSCSARPPAAAHHPNSGQRRSDFDAPDRTQLRPGNPSNNPPFSWSSCGSMLALHTYGTLDERA